MTPENKNILFTHAKTLLVAVPLLLGASVVQAVWNNAPPNPPSGNTPPPIHVGSGSQTKTGTIGVQNLIASTEVSSSNKFCLRNVCITAWPSGGSGGGVQSISAGAGITLTPNPITNTGTVALNTSSLASGCGNATTGKVYWNGSRFVCATDQGSGAISLDDMPSATIAGFCRYSVAPNGNGTRANDIISPAVAFRPSQWNTSTQCSCISGWTSIPLGQGSAGPTGSNSYYACIKN